MDPRDAVYELATCTLQLASFPGLPHFFCSSVSVDNNTRMRKGGIRVLLSTETEEQKKRGRPGNEATLQSQFSEPAVYVPSTFTYIVLNPPMAHYPEKTVNRLHVIIIDIAFCSDNQFT